MARTSPVQFIQQVRAEINKVVWPSRREVVLTTIMVLIMTTVMALFFTLVVAMPPCEIGAVALMILSVLMACNG